MKFFVLLLGGLAAALVACGGDDDDAVTVEPATSTPPSATETDSTATATPSPTGEAGDETPPPTPAVAIPEQPGDFSDWPPVVEAYATEAALTGCPAELLAAWGQAEASCVEADLNGDALRDLVFSFENPALAGQETVPVGAPDPGVVLALLNTGDGFAAGYSATADGGRGRQPYQPGTAPWIGTGDVDGDGLPEFAYLTVQCGAHTCNSTVHVVTSDGQQLFELAPALEMSTLSLVAMGDFDASAGDEIRATGGVVNSVGAGPQRERTEVRGFSGGSWEVRSLAYADSPYLYHRLRDADRLFEANLFEEAIAAYTAALADDSLEDWHALISDGQETDRTVLVPYALLRRGIAEAALVEPSVAATMAEAAALGTIFGEMADFFAADYLDGGYLPGVCEAFRSAFTQADVDAALDFGYENPAPSVASICPF